MIEIEFDEDQIWQEAWYSVGRELSNDEIQFIDHQFYAQSMGWA